MTQRPELRKSAHIRYDVHPQITGEDVYLSMYVQGMEGNISYQWKEDNVDIPASNGGTQPYLYLPKCTKNGNRFVCVVRDSAGDEVTTPPCIVTVSERPQGIFKQFDVQYNDFHKMCFTSMHWTMVDRALYALSKCSDVQPNEFPDKIIEMVKGTLDGYVGKPQPDMLTFYIALCKCGTLYVTDSKNGYPYIFHMDATSRDFAGPLGRMANLWKK